MCSVDVRAMHCRAYGAELILTNVVPDDTMVRGFERHTFICSACHVTEHRMLFMRHGREDGTELLSVHAPPRPNGRRNTLLLQLSSVVLWPGYAAISSR
jgi:hypothetical protein